MRISIWQQFSSNHSASYTVVGEFQTAEAAVLARDTVQQILQEAVAWCFEHREECYVLKAPTPVEQQYGRKYGFDWKERVDWLMYGVDEKSLNQVDRLVIVDTNHVDTWQTGHQFANLLAAMGAKVARTVAEGEEPGITGDVWMGMGIEIKGKADSPEIAASICRELDNSLNQKGSLPVPFLHIYRLTAEHIDQQIFLRHIHFTKIELGLPALMSYLHDNGCTGIEYTIHQIDDR